MHLDSFFFFQAEDGIRDLTVTGVQTCALPIYTAARFGGDEFAIILPETSETGARQLVERINARLMADEESPRLSVSAGVAVYPRDGATAEKLLTSADRELYRNKAAARAATAAAAPVGEVV